ncbi:P-type conjugative transfer protein TrbG [Pantoea agglomerans]|uniref:P-type conjugative transfer protein TrbG n=1 Tax=Enterobacter agglomerans TaxID=549 RepID=UPI0032094AA5
MNKTIIASLMMGCTFLTSHAFAADPLADQYFSQNEPSLTPQEKAAIGIGQRWQTGSDTSKPFAGADGAINYVYSNGQIQVVCAVLQVCDIALQPGENVNNINTGDPRFSVEPAITGSGAAQRLHLIVKPLDVGLDTSLVVTTDRRTYHFRLKSTRNRFMPFISFTYPEDAQAKWDAIRSREQKQLSDNTIPQTGEYLGNLDFNYSVSGSASWKPVRVYNDGKKTIIQFPKTLSSGETPVLLVVRKEGGLFSKDETQQVNLRTQGDRTIVDGLFDKAYLVIGVGSSQEKVTITRG